MTSKAAPAPLAERADIHKSCKSLETLLSVLNDYCEAAGAAVLLQKKLAKALRDAAGTKTTGEVAANAMNTSAVIFEVSSDVNSKFARFADKEYDAISAEVKKWFKKLAKEEKMHDERMASANAKIKQAGQQYEKKTKKNPNDATEEHARYLNLITALGPEMSQEKYNHALNVTQRHAATTNNAASCLSRIADAEWLKTCESVRRFSPTIGQLGEWRSLCEGGWSGPVPSDLPDLSEIQQPQSDRDETLEKVGEGGSPLLPTIFKNAEMGDSRELIEQVSPPMGQSSPADMDPPREILAPRHSPTLGKNNNQTLTHDIPTSGPPSAYPHQRQFPERSNEDTVRSLSAFPLPPTHFPIPPPRQQQTSQSQSSQSSVYTGPRLTESPLPEYADDGDNRLRTSSGSRDAPPSPQQRLRDRTAEPDVDPFSASHESRAAETSLKPVPVRSPTLPLSAETLHADAAAATPADAGIQQANEDRYDGDYEFGRNAAYGAKSRNIDITRPRALERTDTGGSSGSIVAAMRNRYANNSGATSPTQKELPRVSINVNELANRYQPMDGPYPARARASSASSRQLPVIPADTSPKLRQNNSYADNAVPGGSSSTAIDSSRQEEAERRRHQRLNDLAQLEAKEKELELLKREQEIQKRTQELERDRARLHDVREIEEFQDEKNSARDSSVPSPYAQLRPRERKTSFRTQRPLPQLESGNSPTAMHNNSNLGRPNSQYSTSATHLVPPSPSLSSMQPSQSSHTSQYSHSPATSSYTSTSNHAPYCGCEACSTSKYRSPPSPVNTANLRPPAEPITLRPAEKSKPGWIRRLSMPVGNAFNLDSKKGIGIGNIAAGGGLGRSGIFSMDGKKNVSSTALRVDEDGRRSYERSGGIGNQSMTNLGMGRR